MDRPRRVAVMAVMAVMLPVALAGAEECDPDAKRFAMEHYERGQALKGDAR